MSALYLLKGLAQAGSDIISGIRGRGDVVRCPVCNGASAYPYETDCGWCDSEGYVEASEVEDDDGS